MTYIKSLKLSTQVWIWLYKHPDKLKEDSPYWEEIEGMRCNCPLCDFYKITSVISCYNCILLEKDACCYGIYNKVYDYYHYYKHGNIFSDKQKQARAYIASKLRREYEKITGDRKTFKSEEYDECFHCGSVVTFDSGHFHNEDCEYSGCSLCDDPKISDALKDKFFCHYECTISYLKGLGF